MEHYESREVARFDWHNLITEDVTTFGPVNALLSMTGLPSVALIDGVAVPSALDRVVLETACQKPIIL